MKSSNFHTHTVFCDGKDYPEDIVREAIRLGCPAIGFSGHAYCSYDTSWCMSVAKTEEYKSEIERLKAKYKGLIEIYLGIEQDYYSDYDADSYEYVIGGVHAVLKNGAYLSIDESRENQINSVEKYYNGDWYSFIEDYYKTVSDVYRKTKCTVVGHFDLITKFNERFCLFDQKNPRYIKAADSALEALLKEPVVFEINTGAISRGYRTTPYMEDWIINKIKSAGKKLIWTSDCHDKNNLLFGMPETDEDYHCLLREGLKSEIFNS